MHWLWLGPLCFSFCVERLQSSYEFTFTRKKQSFHPFDRSFMLSSFSPIPMDRERCAVRYAVFCTQIEWVSGVYLGWMEQQPTTHHCNTTRFSFQRKTEKKNSLAIWRETRLGLLSDALFHANWSNDLAHAVFIFLTALSRNCDFFLSKQIISRSFEPIESWNLDRSFQLLRTSPLRSRMIFQW